MTPDKRKALIGDKMLYTTKRLLKKYSACEDRYNYLFERIDADEDDVIPLTLIFEINGLDDALWALRAVPQKQKKQRDRIARLMACDFAKSVLPIFEEKYPNDMRPRNAIKIARKFANGNATQEELETARAAGAAAWDDRAAARAAALAAAWAAALAAARAAAEAIAWAAAKAAAEAIAEAATRAVEMEKQKKIFLKWVK